MEEVWKDIEGYEKLYQVSNFGNVKSLDHYASNGKKEILYKGKTLQQQKHKKTGYLSVELSKNNKQKRIMVHRLVARAFIDNPNKMPCINHIDEDKTNNKAQNLEWCNHKYNNNYGENTKKLCKPVLQYDLNGNFIKEYYGANEASRQLKIGCTNICKCCRGERKKTKGFVFKYKKEENI